MDLHAPEITEITAERTAKDTRLAQAHEKTLLLSSIVFHEHSYDFKLKNPFSHELDKILS